MTGTLRGFRSARRSFLQQSVWGMTGGLLAAGASHAWAQETGDSLKIVKVEPILLTGIRGSRALGVRARRDGRRVRRLGRGHELPGRPADCGGGDHAEQRGHRPQRVGHRSAAGTACTGSSTTTAWAASSWPPSAASTWRSTTSSARSWACRSTSCSAARCTKSCARTPMAGSRAWRTRPDAYAARTQELVARGYTGCKLDPFFVTPMNREVTQPDLRLADVNRQGHSRGRWPRLRHRHRRARRWDTKSTLEIIRALEPMRLFFYEEAVPPENVAAMAEVQRNTQTPLATGERIFGRQGFRELLEQQAVRIIQPDLAPAPAASPKRRRSPRWPTRTTSRWRRTTRTGRICTLASMHLCFCDPELPDPRVLREGRAHLQRPGHRRPPSRCWAASIRPPLRAWAPTSPTISCASTSSTRPGPTRRNARCSTR